MARHNFSLGPVIRHLRIYRGTELVERLPLPPGDWSGFSPVAQLRADVGQPLLATAESAIDGSDVVLRVASADTDNLPDNGWWDCLLVGADGGRRMFARGRWSAYGVITTDTTAPAGDFLIAADGSLVTAADGSLIVV